MQDVDGKRGRPIHQRNRLERHGTTPQCSSTWTHVSHSQLRNVTTERKEPCACTLAGILTLSNEPHASPGLFSSNAFILIKASPIFSSKSHIVLNKPHALLFGHYIEMNKPSLRNKPIGCYISQSRVPFKSIKLKI